METGKKLLQAAIAIACIVPIAGGLLGVVQGSEMLEFGGNLSLDSHVRYLSGLLLAVGFGFLSTIPRIERHRTRFGLLSGIVVVGGLARLYGIASNGWPGSSMIFALGMELLLVPVLCLWQRQVASKLHSEKCSLGVI